jgi:hypothetical protein
VGAPDEKGRGEDRSTAPPPFDPAEYARESESQLRVDPDHKPTTQIRSLPKLKARVRIVATDADLEWFEMSDEARALLARVDGKKTLLELMEEAGVPAADVLRAFGELHDLKLLAYDE